MDRNQRLVSVTGPFPGSMNDMDTLERTMVSLGKKQQERDGEVWLIVDSAYVSRGIERAENGQPSSSQCQWNSRLFTMVGGVFGGIVALYSML